MLRTNKKIVSDQRIKFSEFRKEIRTTSPHKHNKYIEFIYLQEGQEHTIDGKPYPVIPPVFFTVLKEQVHHWALKDKPSGYVLILGRNFIDSGIDRVLQDLLNKISMANCIYVKDSKPLSALFELLLESTIMDFGHHADYTEGLLRSLLAKLLLQPKPHNEMPKLQGETFVRFEALLSYSSDLRNSVAFYAGALGTTPQNLNAICRKSVGQSSTEVLATYLIEEAKRLLFYTDMYTAQICTVLRFKDSSHFIKYFKRYTGVTPNEFRKQVRGSTVE